ncbi:MAG: glycosyltransferase family 4 protein [Burkholderiaceae bacterium]|nr:glycosyltransferase family 4 protein [Burkholderiaceae bacterium]
MRLLVVTQYFWPEDFRINELVAELVARGHAVTVLTGLPNYPDGRVFPAYARAPDEFVLYRGARVLRVPLAPRGRGSLRLILNYLSFVITASTLGPWRLRGERFDAIFAFEPSPITVGLPAVLLRRLKGAPLVFWVLDLWPETLEAVGAVRSSWLLRGVGRLVSFIYDRCDLVLAQSRSFIPQIARWCADASRIAYFPNWVESVYDMAGAALAPEVPPREGSFDVMFAGNIGEAQDFPAILDAAEQLKDHPTVRWLIVGDGRRADWVRQEIARRGLGERVLMLGRFPVERMPSFYRHADALLVSLKPDPIFSMTIPGKVQSYLAAGVPVVAMLDGEGARVIERAGAGMVCAAGDGIGLATAVGRLAAMSATQRAAMGANGARLAADEFGRDVLIGRLERWLEQLTRGEPATTLQEEGQ